MSDLASLVTAQRSQIDAIGAERDKYVTWYTASQDANGMIMQEHTYAVGLLTALYTWASEHGLVDAETWRYLNGDWTPDDAPEKGGGDE